MGPNRLSKSIFRLRCLAALPATQFQRNAMKQAGTNKNSTHAAHISHNGVECLSLRCQFAHCFGGSTINNITAVMVDRSVPAATANRAILTQLLVSNSGGCVFIVTVAWVKSRSVDGASTASAVPQTDLCAAAVALTCQVRTRSTYLLANFRASRTENVQPRTPIAAPERNALDGECPSTNSPSMPPTHPSSSNGRV
jgi:hypothetical protein